MRIRIPILCLAALAAWPAAAQMSPSALPSECVEVNTKARARLDDRNLAEADAALSESTARGDTARDSLCDGLTLHNLAVVAYSAGRFAEAEALEERALKLFRAGRDHRDAALLQPLFYLWLARHVQGKVGRAREALQSMRSIPIAKPEDRFLVSEATGNQFFAEGRFADAEREFQNALRECDHAGRCGTQDAASVLVGLGSLHTVQGRLQDAERALQQAFEIVNFRRETPPLDRIELFSVRGLLRVRQARWREAEMDMRAAIVIADREATMPPAFLRPLLTAHAFVLRKMRRNSEASAVEARARSIEAPPGAVNVVDITQLADGFKRR